MRLTASFTLHAILAACLAALAASSAAAGKPVIDNEGHVYLTMRLLGSGAKDQEEQLEVHSFHWGPRQSTSADGSRTRSGNQISLDDTPGGSAAKERQAGMAEMVAERDKSEGQATGKRQHKPMLARGNYDQAPPAPSGSLTVLASGGSCRVGARYPSLTLNGRGKAYLLQEVEVVDCAATDGGNAQFTLVYRKVTVKGWDPEK